LVRNHVKGPRNGSKKGESDCVQKGTTSLETRETLRWRPFVKKRSRSPGVRENILP